MNNILLTTISFLYFLFRGKADKKVLNPKKILVMQATPNLGDMVCITPLFRAIKKKYPKSTVYLMSRGKGAEITKGNPYIDERLALQGSSRALITLIKSKNIDVAVATNPSTSGLAILYLAGIPCISSFVIPKPQYIYSRLYDWLRHLVIQIPLRTGTFVPRQYLDLLSPIGITTDDTQLELYYTPEAEKNIPDTTGLTIAIAPGGSTDIRWWGLDKYAALADYAHEKYHAKIFFIGAGADKVPIDGVIENLDPKTPYTNLLNQPLEEFKAFLSKISLVIGNDSGPMTIAKAFKRPQMVFIGPTDAREYQWPNGPTNRIVTSPTRGQPLTNSANWNFYDEKKAKQQMAEITLEQAKQELDFLMKNIQI